LSILWIDAICGSVQNSMTPPEKNVVRRVGKLTLYQFNLVKSYAVPGGVALILAGLLLCLVHLEANSSEARSKPRSCAALAPIRSPTTSPPAMPSRTAKGSGESIQAERSLFLDEAAFANASGSAGLAPIPNLPALAPGEVRPKSERAVPSKGPESGCPKASAAC
jgi:hypothetical protein